jgi:hypothetical protein
LGRIILDKSTKIGVQTKRDEPLGFDDFSHDISASTPPPSFNVDFIPENTLEFNAEGALDYLEPDSTQIEELRANAALETIRWSSARK